MSEPSFYPYYFTVNFIGDRTTEVEKNKDNYPRDTTMLLTVKGIAIFIVSFLFSVILSVVSSRLFSSLLY